MTDEIEVEGDAIGFFYDIAGHAAEARAAAEILESEVETAPEIAELETSAPWMDIVGEETAQRAALAVREVVRQARDDREPTPPLDVVTFDELDALDVTVLGADQPRGAPRYLRVDTEDSYRDFVADGSPELAALRDKVEELEAALQAHIDDPDAHILGMIEDISVLLPEAEAAQRRVPLRLPPWAEGKIDCWREGDVICCSIRLPGPDGKVRLCTSAAPLADGVIEVIGCASRAGIDVVDVLGALPEMACVLVGASVAKMLLAAAPSALSRPEVRAGEVFVGAVVRPDDRVRAGALVALLQRCDAGNAAACSEWAALVGAAKIDSSLAWSMRRAKELLQARRASRGSA